MATTKPRTAVRSAAVVGLGYAAAFLPKCPVCWAAYSSALGLGGLAHIPGLKYLFPVVGVMLGAHLLLLLRQSRRVGYVPFLLSLTGAFAILAARQYNALPQPLLTVGVILLLGGSVWNTLGMNRRGLSKPTETPTS